MKRDREDATRHDKSLVCERDELCDGHCGTVRYLRGHAAASRSGERAVCAAQAIHTVGAARGKGDWPHPMMAELKRAPLCFESRSDPPHLRFCESGPWDRLYIRRSSCPNRGARLALSELECDNV